MSGGELVERLHAHTSTIFTEMTALAMRHGAVNLGQGAPDFSGPEAITEVAVQAIRDGRNQYAPGPGIRPLRQAIADHQHRMHDLDWDPDTEVTVCAGATEGIAATILSLCSPGDEVVALAPFYDSYPAATALAGATFHAVALVAPTWDLDRDLLAATIGPRTRLLLVNTPHNPTGRVLSRADMEFLAELCQRHDVLVMTDEVYEHLVFDNHEHVPMAGIDGMRQRTISLSSAGKTFSVTGWKVGWATAPPSLTDAFRAAKMWLTFTNGTPFQFAIAEALQQPDAWFDGYRTDYTRRRQVLLDAATEHGIHVATPEGTYFALLDIAELGIDPEVEDGLALCRRMPGDHGVAAIPTQVFHLDPSHGRRWIRLAFCKDDDAIREGIRRLAAVREG